MERTIDLKLTAGIVKAARHAAGGWETQSCWIPLIFTECLRD